MTQCVYMTVGDAEAAEAFHPWLIQVLGYTHGVRGSGFSLGLTAVPHCEPRLHSQRIGVFPREPGYFCTGGRAACKMHGILQPRRMEQGNRIAVEEARLIRR